MEMIGFGCLFVGCLVIFTRNSGSLGWWAMPLAIASLLFSIQGLIMFLSELSKGIDGQSKIAQLVGIRRSYFELAYAVLFAPTPPYLDQIRWEHTTA